MDNIAKQAGDYPDYWLLFKRNPGHWLIAFFSPYSGATYYLNIDEPEYEEKAIQLNNEEPDIIMVGIGGQQSDHGR